MQVAPVALELLELLLPLLALLRAGRVEHLGVVRHAEPVVRREVALLAREPDLAVEPGPVVGQGVPVGRAEVAAPALLEVILAVVDAVHRGPVPLHALREEQTFS